MALMKKILILMGLSNLCKFNSLILEDQYEPCEEDGIHEKAFISSDKEDSSESCLPLHPNKKLPKSLSPKVVLEVLKIKAC